MASVRIIGNIVSTTRINRYSSNDTNLITSKNLQENFGGEGDYIEHHLYDIGGNFLYADYSYLDYSFPPNENVPPGVNYPPNTTGNIQTENIGIESTLAPTTGSYYPTIVIDPVNDIQNLGFSSGEYKSQYNFFTNIISNNVNRDLFVKEISSDRTEIRLASTTLSDTEIEDVVTSMMNEMNNSTYYVDYLLNFGNNEVYLAINVALNRASDGYEVLFKLYQPLPLSVQIKQTLWVVEEKVIPYVFDINLDKSIIPDPATYLRGPNFNIPISANQGTVASQYNNYSNLVTGLQSLQNSSYQQILNLLATQSVNINVDYNVNTSADFSNFVFFGSAYQRIFNFYGKVKEIEDYNNFIISNSPFTSSTPSLITEINQYSSSINTIITQFDGYETYLYFESSSYTWPKSGSTKPYSLLSTGSATVISWYNNLTSSAQNYDLDNYNNLEYAVPEFLRNDENNQPFLLFLNMIGQYFDNIWIYLKAITDINLANNNLNYGISKDLVHDHLISLGVHLYNSQAGENVDQYLIGANTGSSVWNNDTSVTSSYLNNIPRKDLVSEVYKRIYHNLPLLLKTKGTVSGLEHLITTFGIPVHSNLTEDCSIYLVSASYGPTPADTVVSYIPCGQNNVIEYNVPVTFSGDIQVYIEANNTLVPYFSTLGDGVSITKISSYQGILGVKEFGGSLKSDLLKGYNNDKVRIIPNSIVSNTVYSGSVLSPFHSLQTFPTASNDFRENDDHYIDISFSPQSQIDLYISGAIASNNPTWSLDNYIGDPNQQYLTTYPDLDAQRKLYFQTGVPGFAPFTASLLDYNGFIRLVEYFDNSLFKMLEDFVPERASLSTGVTFNSPVLERNKVTYANPTNSTTESVYSGVYDYNTNNILFSSYGTFYNALSSSNNTMGWYDGEISGSVVNVYQYFTDNNNPYLLGNWSVWNAQHDPTQSINMNSFLHSDWNVLLNNVSQSVKSLYRNHIEYIYGTTGSILTPAELQDSYLTLRSYNISRYEGSKTTSLLYNTYTSASYTGSDGLRLSVQNGDKSYGKTAAIDHTVRKIGLFTQVEKSSFINNKSRVALKYLVNEFGELTELNQQNYNWEEVQNTFKLGDTATVSLFDNKKYSNQKRTDGIKSIFNSGYSYTPVFYYANTDLTASFDLTSVLSNTANMFQYELYGGILTADTASPTGSYTYDTDAFLVARIQNIFGNSDRLVYNYGSNYTPGAGGTYGQQYFAQYVIPETNFYSFVLENFNITRTGGTIPAGTQPTYLFYISASDGYNTSITPGTNTRALTSISSRTPLRQYTAGTTVNFYMKRTDPTGASGYTESISRGGLLYSSHVGVPYAVPPFTSSVSPNAFCLDEQFSYLYGNLFQPEGTVLDNGTVIPSSSLFPSYGSVDYNFTINPGDIIRFEAASSYISYEFEVLSVDLTPGTSVCFNINGAIPGDLVTQLQSFTPNAMADDVLSRVIFLKKVPDETSVLLDFKKPPGLTSYGFLIPENLAKDVLLNINTITSQVKTKLVNDQGSIITDINGGGF
jgi:hypothetical protein